MLVSGVFYDASGALPSITVSFTADKTTLNGVLVASSAEFTTQEDGSYAIELEPGYYTVRWGGGKSPTKVLGRIVADESSTLTLPQALEASPTPVTTSEAQDFLTQVTQQADRAESEATTAEQSALSASQSATAASDSADDAEQAATTAAADVETNIESYFDIWVKDVERQALEAASGGLCTIERTTNGQACHMFVLPKTRWEDLLPGQELGTGVHEAFLENGIEKSELLIGMYQASTVNGELVSQARKVLRRSITWDASRTEAQAAGFDMMSNWEWSAIAFWCMANGFQPRGNTDYGQSHSHPHEQGVNVEYDNVSTGSGPNTWNHNNAQAGIADLVGNVWEWQWGFKMLDGRILLAPDNDKSLVESSWVDTGYDLPGEVNPWSSLSQVGATQQVQRALIVPNGVSDPDGRLYANLTGERFPLRGGTRYLAANAGLGALYLASGRSVASAGLGLRLSRLV